MIEAIMAGIIIISFISFLSVSNFIIPEEDLTPPPLAYKTLAGLNSQGFLRTNVDSENFAAIDEQVKSHTPRQLEGCGYSEITFWCFRKRSWPKESDYRRVCLFISIGKG